MLTDYIRAAMKRAKYEMLEENEGFFGSIDGMDLNSKVDEVA